MEDEDVLKGSGSALPGPGLIQEIEALAPPGNREPVIDFAKAMFRRLEELPPAAAPRAVHAFVFLDRRTTGGLAVRGFNPTQDEHGYEAAGSVLEISVEDRPFLLTTVTEELRRLGLHAEILLHPIVGVERDADGRVEAVVRARSGALRESLIHVELDRRLSDERLNEIVQDLVAALRDALVVTGDFNRMRDRLEETARALETAAAAGHQVEQSSEASALLRWLLDEHFILLGTCEYDIVAGGEERRVLRPGSGFGILREQEDPFLARLRVPQGRLISLVRTGRVATVHRQVRMFAVAVRILDEQGRCQTEQRALGLFTQRGYAEPASTTPVLRRLLQQIIEAEDLVDDSYDEQQLRALFEALPKHELFAADPGRLRASLVALLAARHRQDVRVLGSADPDAGRVSILVAVPRDRFSPSMRLQVQNLLARRFGATGVDYHLSLDEGGQALLQFGLAVPRAEAEALDDAHLDDLEDAVVKCIHGFVDELAAELSRLHSPLEARRLSAAFIRRLPPSYLENADARTGALDISEVVALGSGSDPVRMVLRHGPADPAELHRLRVYRHGPAIELSDFLPILENLGLTVADQVSHRLKPLDPGEEQVGPVSAVFLSEFGVRADRNLFGSMAVDVERDGPRLADAVMAVLGGACESDSLNRLVLVAGLRWEDVEVLRAYRHYRRQIGTAFTPRFHDDALVANPVVAGALISLFAARFDPDLADADSATAARQRALDALDEVDHFDEDRILRGFLGLIDATVRTNRYAPARTGCLALKFDSTRVPGMPEPVPAFEVFVAGPRVQGVHLRGGRVARGGIRWSDRREDFRTEVLGLMKAQMTKNAVIVPTGSKGGFVLTRGGSDPLTTRDEVRRAYATFVRGLLDVTDNVVEGKVVGPPRVRRYDGDDPYLVVAPDRGTATFSDLANEISEDYGFWLDDAFASGGSRGYDHKAMGITARGAWLAVRRHFRELDLDVQSDPVTVVGIGDMSGDVFGNAMQRSRSIRLVAAFDHRHIFLDPDPDAEGAFHERARLAALSHSSWRDYDEEAISAGGGVWSRTQREIPLSPQVRSLLRLDAEHLSPPELIRAILRAPVDLLFAGGIGTFVRATSETDVQVGDRANDAVRVTADELGARVVGEGGNLAMTQRARIQYARRGGRCNTDAIDNAGGVDISDREVNLKILFRTAIEAGELDEAERDVLLADMTEEVAAAVLLDVDRQTAALSAELHASPRLLEAYEALMGELVEAGRLDRDVEVLPGSAEMARRREAGAGMTRPELAVLLGYAKVDHVTRLLASDLPDEPWLRSALHQYFPPLAVERFGHLIGYHRLRRELVATVVSNDLVNRMGITYVSRTAHEHGCFAWEVAAAWWAAREVAAAEWYWTEIEALDERTTPALQLELESEVDGLVDTLTRSYLRMRIGSAVGAVVARDHPAFAELTKSVDEIIPPARRSDRALRLRRWMDLGIDPGLASRLAGLRELSVVPDVAAVAAVTERTVRHIGEVFWRLSESLPLDELHARLGAVHTRGSWQYWQQQGLSDELRELRRMGATLVVQEYPDDEPADAVGRFLRSRAEARDRVRVLLRTLDLSSEANLDGIAVAVRALRAALRLSEPFSYRADSTRAQRWSSGT